VKAAFVGKDRVAGREVAHLEALGMAVALAGGDLVTTPAGGAASAVARGFQRAAGRPAERDRVPPNTDSDPVLFYDDGNLYQKLLAKEPSPIDERWVVLTDLDRLEIFVATALFTLDSQGHPIS
jgi:hypothetical protein